MSDYTCRTEEKKYYHLFKKDTKKYLTSGYRTLHVVNSHQTIDYQEAEIPVYIEKEKEIIMKDGRFKFELEQGIFFMTENKVGTSIVKRRKYCDDTLGGQETLYTIDGILEPFHESDLFGSKEDLLASL